MENTYAIKPNHEHYELYINGKLYCCTDTYAEAKREIKEYERETSISKIADGTTACGVKLSKREIRHAIDCHTQCITELQTILDKYAVMETPEICDFCGTELEPFEADDLHIRTYICPHCARIITVRKEL